MCVWRGRYMSKKHLSVLDHGGGLNWRTATNNGSRTGEEARSDRCCYLCSQKVSV